MPTQQPTPGLRRPTLPTCFPACSGPPTRPATAPVPDNVKKLRFDPLFGAHLEVANDQSLDSATYSLSGWIEVEGDSTSGDYFPIAVRGATDANDIEIYVQPPEGRLVVAHNRGNGGTFDFAVFTPPPLNDEFHLVVTYNASTGAVAAYYDGISQTIVEQNSVLDGTIGVPTDTNKGWWFGKVDHVDFGGAELFTFDGTMDEIELFDRGRVCV